MMVPAEAIPHWFTEPPLHLVTDWEVSPTIQAKGGGKLYRGKITIKGRPYHRYVLTNGGTWREALDFPVLKDPDSMVRLMYRLLLVKRQKRLEAKGK